MTEQKLTTKVFLSYGRPASTEQRDFVIEVESLLLKHGLSPQRAQLSSDRPLCEVQAVMRECAGTIVLAYERVLMQNGIEMRGHPSCERMVTNRKLTSIWVQIEAAVAYSLKHPLLVVCEDGLQVEGFLETGHDWLVARVEILPTVLDAPAFRETFSRWKDRVINFQSEADV